MSRFAIVLAAAVLVQAGARAQPQPGAERQPMAGMIIGIREPKGNAGEVVDQIEVRLASESRRAYFWQSFSDAITKVTGSASRYRLLVFLEVTVAGHEATVGVRIADVADADSRTIAFSVPFCGIEAFMDYWRLKLEPAVEALQRRPPVLFAEAITPRDPKAGDDAEQLTWRYATRLGETLKDYASVVPAPPEPLQCPADDEELYDYVATVILYEVPPTSFVEPYWTGPKGVIRPFEPRIPIGDLDESAKKIADELAAVLMKRIGL